jgi:SM-20-related protein
MSDDYFKPFLNPAIDIDLAQASFAFQRRVQIGAIFEETCANAIHACLVQETPWGFAWWNGHTTAFLCKQEIDALAAEHAGHIAQHVQALARSGEFSFAFHCHPLFASIEAQAKWMTPPLLDDLLAFLNSRDLLELVKEISNCSKICKADAHATLFAPNQFQSPQQENGTGQKRLAYALNFTHDWREDWGGYLQFYGANGDILQGYKPQYNSLSLCDVSQAYGISVVPSHAPYGHLAIRGYFYEVAD